MLLLAVRPLDLAIFGIMGCLWIFGATFIYFVWKWAVRTEDERANPVMRAGDPPIPPAAPLPPRAPKARPSKSADLGAALPNPAST